MKNLGLTTELRDTLREVRTLARDLDAELELRQSRRLSPEIATFAADFDIVHEYIHGTPKTKTLASQAACKIFETADDLAFTFFPGAIHELLSFCRRIAISVPRTQSVDELLEMLGNIDKPSIGFEALEDPIRNRLVHLLDELWKHQSIAVKLAQLLASDNLKSVGACGAPKSGIAPNPRARDITYTLLAQLRPSIPANNVQDSLNISWAVGATEAGLTLPLVTGSKFVLEAVGHALPLLDDRTGMTDIVFSTHRAILRIALRRASLSDVRDLKHAVRRACLASDRIAELAHGAFSGDINVNDSWSECVEILLNSHRLLDGWLSLDQVAAKRWDVDEIPLPQSADLPQLARLGLEVSLRIDKALHEIVARAAAKLEEVDSKVEQLKALPRPFRQVADLIGVLASSGEPRSVVIHNLIVSGEGGGEMKFKVLNVSDSNLGFLNAGEVSDIQCIDSQIWSIKQGGDEDIVAALQAITEGIARDISLAAREREELLEQFRELSRQINAHRNGRAQAGVVRSLLASIGATLAGGGGAAEIWSTWGDTITEFFSDLLGGS